MRLCYYRNHDVATKTKEGVIDKELKKNNAPSITAKTVHSRSKNRLQPATSMMKTNTSEKVASFWKPST